MKYRFPVAALVVVVLLLPTLGYGGPKNPGGSSPALPRRSIKPFIMKKPLKNFPFIPQCTKEPACKPGYVLSSEKCADLLKTHPGYEDMKDLDTRDFSDCYACEVEQGIKDAAKCAPGYGGFFAMVGETVQWGAPDNSPYEYFCNNNCEQTAPTEAAVKKCVNDLVSAGYPSKPCPDGFIFKAYESQNFFVPNVTYPSGYTCYFGGYNGDNNKAPDPSPCARCGDKHGSTYANGELLCIGPKKP